MSIVIVISNKFNKFCVNFDYRFQYVFVKVQVIILIITIFTLILNTNKLLNKLIK